MSLEMVPVRVGGDSAKQNNRTLAAWNQQHLTQQERPAHAIRETPYVTSMCMIPWPPLTSIGLILT